MFDRGVGGWGCSSPGTSFADAPADGPANRRDRDDSEKVSAQAFAREAGTSADRVLRHLDAWERASADGIVPAAATLAPGVEVDLDVEELPDWGVYYDARKEADPLADDDREFLAVVRALRQQFPDAEITPEVIRAELERRLKPKPPRPPAWASQVAAYAPRGMSVVDPKRLLACAMCGVGMFRDGVGGIDPRVVIHDEALVDRINAWSADPDRDVEREMVCVPCFERETGIVVGREGKSSPYRERLIDADVRLAYRGACDSVSVLESVRTDDCPEATPSE
jgi:hypothetical protein